MYGNNTTLAQRRIVEEHGRLGVKVEEVQQTYEADGVRERGKAAGDVLTPAEQRKIYQGVAPIELDRYESRQREEARGEHDKKQA